LGLFGASAAARLGLLHGQNASNGFFAQQIDCKEYIRFENFEKK
jgi:hypothetical protein